MSELKRYQANPAVSCGDEEDGAILYNPDIDDTVILNLTGRAVWRFLEEPHSVDELAAWLATTHQGVTLEQAAEDAAQFIQSLLPDFLLEASSDC